ELQGETTAPLSHWYYRRRKLSQKVALATVRSMIHHERIALMLIGATPPSHQFPRSHYQTPSFLTWDFNHSPELSHPYSHEGVVVASWISLLKRPFADSITVSRKLFR